MGRSRSTAKQLLKNHLMGFSSTTLSSLVEVYYNATYAPVPLRSDRTRKLVGASPPRPPAPATGSGLTPVRTAISGYRSFGNILMVSFHPPRWQSRRESFPAIRNPRRRSEIPPSATVGVCRGVSFCGP